MFRLYSYYDCLFYEFLWVYFMNFYVMVSVKLVIPLVHLAGTSVQQYPDELLK